MADEKATKKDEKKEQQRAVKPVEICVCKTNCPATDLYRLVIDETLAEAKNYFFDGQIKRQLTVENVADLLAGKRDFYANNLRNRSCHQSGLLTPVIRSAILKPLDDAIIMLTDYEVDKHGPLTIEELEASLGR